MNTTDKCLLVIEIEEVLYMVRGQFEEVKETGKFQKDKCYIRDGLVYIYGGKLKSDSKPGYFYRNGDTSEYTFVEPRDPEEHSVEHIRDVMKAKEEICDSNNLKEITDDMTADGADLHVFAPPLKESDDPLKRMVKLALLELQIDLKSLRHEFSKEYDLTNLKASVTKTAPLTMKYFVRWLEVLDIRLDLNISSKGTKRIKKLPKTITLTIE